MFAKIITITFSALLAIVLAHRNHAQSISEMLLPFAERLSVPVHGNWCGPGHGGTAASRAPCVDELDCQCKKHDHCWEKYGNLNCKCDMDLVESLAGTTDPIGITIREYFMVSPCVGPVIFPFPKICKDCVKIFGKRTCVDYPCGFENKCKMGPVVRRKGTKDYKC